MAGRTSIADMAILLGIDSSGVDAGVKEAQGKLNGIGFGQRGDVFTDKAFATQSRMLDKKFQKAEVQQNPFLVRKGAALAESKEHLEKALNVEKARQKLGTLGAAAASFGNDLSEAAEHAAIFAPLAGFVGGILAAEFAAVKGIFELAKAADPAAAEAWDRAWADLTMVLGGSFVEILTSATQGLRDFADVIKTIQGFTGGQEQGWLKTLFHSATGHVFQVGTAVKNTMKAAGIDVADTTGIADKNKASFKGISQLSDDVLQAAFEAQGGSPAQKQVDLLELANQKLQEIALKLGIEGIQRFLGGASAGNGGGGSF